MPLRRPASGVTSRQSALRRGVARCRPPHDAVLVAPVASPFRRSPATGPGRSDDARRDDADPKPPSACGRQMGSRPDRGRPPREVAQDHRQRSGEARRGPASVGTGADADAGVSTGGGMASPRGNPPRTRKANRRGLNFFAHIDAYTGLCRGQGSRLHAKEGGDRCGFYCGAFGALSRPGRLRPGALGGAGGSAHTGHRQPPRRTGRDRLRGLYRPDGRGRFRRGAAHVWGYLDKVNFKEGALVKKGDVLFEIDPRPYQATLNQAKANVAQDEAQLRATRRSTSGM